MTDEEEIKNHQSVAPSPHSAYVLNNAELFKFHDEGWFEVKIPLWTLHKVLNKDGVIRIGDKIKKYTSSAIKIIHDGDDKKVALLENVNESQPKKGIEVINITHLRYDITNTSSNAKLIDRDMQVNTCTNRVDRYRVRLYEDIVHYGLGNGTLEIVHGFRVYSFRHTVYGWQRRFKTNSLAGRVDYQASYGSGGKYIQANGKQHSIGWELATVQYSSFNEQYIYWRRGEAWGRNGCYCSYEESYP